MEEREEKTVKYGGSNNIIEQICPRCGKSPDKHRFPYIESGEDSRKLMSKLQIVLSNVDKTELIKGYEREGYTTTMMGTAVATIGTEKREYVSLSGPGVALLSHIDRGVIGPKVYVVDVISTPIYDIQGKTFNLVPPVRIGNGRDYVLGSCAAQKLLSQIFKDAKDLKREVNTLDMSELFWLSASGEGHNRDWSTGEIVQSCDTCKQVVPQMLCTCWDS